jgi:16S rRNA (cytosine1402-N4)-methyltransferase
MGHATEHQAVLSTEALAALRIQSAGRYVDGTFGRGGHSGAILAALQDDGGLLAIDKDPAAVAFGRALFGGDSRFVIKQGSFALLDRFVGQLGWYGKVNGILLDLGVSSPQLEDAERGFSFSHDGPLDMRMDNSGGMTAAQWLAKAETGDIAQVIREYGEERFAKRIARAIVSARGRAPIRTTGQLAEIIADAAPTREKGKHPATRSFQAIRIHINGELADLRECLRQALGVLAPEGRLVVISFHSLEDRIVKRFVRDNVRGDLFPLGVPVTQDQMRPKLKSLGKAIRPTAREVESNTRARSAVLRVAERLA